MPTTEIIMTQVKHEDWTRLVRNLPDMLRFSGNAVGDMVRSGEKVAFEFKEDTFLAGKWTVEFLGNGRAKLVAGTAAAARRIYECGSFVSEMMSKEIMDAKGVQAVRAFLGGAVSRSTTFGSFIMTLIPIDTLNKILHAPPGTPIEQIMASGNQA